jgi:hypothetical protein
MAATEPDAPGKLPPPVPVPPPPVPLPLPVPAPAEPLAAVVGLVAVLVWLAPPPQALSNEASSSPAPTATAPEVRRVIMDELVLLGGTRSSFGAKGVDWGHASGPAGGVDPEDQSDSHGYADRSCGGRCGQGDRVADGLG